MKRLMRIALTPVDIADGEAAMITRVLDAGWDMVHLRHPASSLADVRRLIEAVPQRFHSRLRLHGHFALASEFNLGGLHLNSRCPAPPAFYTGPLSRSCHTVDEVIASQGYDYVTLSPVFPSVSKPGYGENSNFSASDLDRIDKMRPTSVIALGGVTPATLQELARMPFQGFATLGYLLGCGNPALLPERLLQFEQTIKTI